MTKSAQSFPLFLILFCLSHSPTSYAESHPLHILVDPGHGGIDSGAANGSVRESDLSLKVAELLKGLLEKNPGFKVSLTRSSDKFVSLPARVAQVEKVGADLFLSIHANSSQDKRARGVEFYFQNHLPPDEETLFLAANENRMEKINEKEDLEPSKKNEVLSIIDDLKRQTRMFSSLKLSSSLLKSWSSESGAELKFENNAIRQAPFYVVSRSPVPSVLVEIGFLTNPKDAEKLKDPQFQQRIAQRIYSGLRDYKEMIDKSEARTLKSSP